MIATFWQWDPTLLRQVRTDLHLLDQQDNPFAAAFLLACAPTDGTAQDNARLLTALILKFVAVQPVIDRLMEQARIVMEPTVP